VKYHPLIVHYDPTPASVSVSLPLLIQPFTIWSFSTPINPTYTNSALVPPSTQTCSVASVDNIHLYLVTCPSLHIPTTGSYTYTLTATNQGGQSDQYIKTVTVTSAVSCGHFSLVPEAQSSSTARLAWFADPLVATFIGTTFSFTINWGDGKTTSATPGSTALFTHSYSTVGSFTVSISSSICEGPNCNECAPPAFSAQVVVEQVTQPTIHFGPFGSLFVGTCTSFSAQVNNELVTSCTFTGDSTLGPQTCSQITVNSATLTTVTSPVVCFSQPGVFDLIFEVSNGVEAVRATSPVTIVPIPSVHEP